MSEKRTRGLGLTQTHPKRWRQWPRIIERRWRQEILEVAQASLHLTSSLELERVLESILAYALKLLAAYGAHIFLYDGSRLTFAAALWSDGRRGEPYALPREDGLTYQVARSGQRMVVPDVDHHSLFENYRWGGAIVGLPILLEGQVQGVMNVAFERPRHFDQDELWLLDLLAEQAANTLQNARLFAAERRQRQATETLREVTAALTSTLDLDQVLNSILGHLAKVVPYDSASVMLLEGDGLRVVAGRGFPDPARIEGAIFPAASPHFETLYQTQQAHFVPDVYLDDRFERWEGFEYIRGWMGVPLIARGQVIGCLTLDSRTVGAFGQAAAALAQGFANQAAVAIQNAQLFQESQRQARYATLVNKMIYEAAVARDLRTVLQTLADRMGQLLNADGCYITLWDEGRRKVIPAAASGQFAEIYPLLHTEPGEVTMTEAVLQNGRALAAEDVFHSPYVNQRVVALFPTHSLLALPFLAGAQKIGAALLAFDQPRHFTAEEIARGEQAASQIALALHRAQVLETLEQRVEQRTRELSRANEQLQELDRLKTRFMADVSHELRTPITNLGLYLSLLKQGKPEKQASYLQTLEQQVARLEQLVSAVLNLSRLEAGGGGAGREWVDLNDVIRQVVAQQRPRAEAAGLSFTFTPRADLPPVPGKPNQLAMMVTHLLANAISFTAAGFVRVSTGVEGNPGQVFVEVADSGAGIDSEDMPHLFERFYRGRQAGQSHVPGAGLGLAIVKEIVNLHQGKIAVQSRPGEGSTFRVWLPLAEKT